MTSKKYALTFIVFAFLLALVPVLLFVGLSLRENNEFAFYTFISGSCLSLILAIIFIAVNYKKLVAYDMSRLSKRISNLDFSIVDTSISENELCDKLAKSGYKHKEKIFHKVIEDNLGDGHVVNHYYATIHKVNEIVDIQRILECFSKGMTTYNIAYIFVGGNIEENIEKIRNYIKETILDVKMHAYRYKNFFVPIIVTNDRVYYVEEAGIFMDTYKFGIVEGVRVINDQ